MHRARAGQLIRAARLDNSMTQSQLAQAAGIHQPSLAAYELARRTPRPETLRAILKAAKTRPSIPLQLFADDILAAATGRGLSNVRVFGSTIRGEDTESSDIDLLVSVSADSSLFDLAGFSLDVERITGFRADVIADSAALGGYLAHVREEAIAL